MGNLNFDDQARAIFERTALARSDIKAIPITQIVSRELLEIANLFETMIADDGLEQDVVLHLQNYIQTARHYASVLPHHPFATLEFEGQPQPVHKIAAELCLDIADFIDGWHLQPEWRSHYDNTLGRLRRYAADLREKPGYKVKYM